MTFRDPTHAMITLALGFGETELGALRTELLVHDGEIELRQPGDPMDLENTISADDLDAVIIRESDPLSAAKTIRHLRSCSPSVGITVIAHPTTSFDDLLGAGAHEVLDPEYSPNDLRIAVRRSAARAFAIIKTTPASTLAVFDRLPVPMYRTLVSGEFIQANDPMARLVGYERGHEMIGAHISAFHYDQSSKNGQTANKELPDLFDEPEDAFRTETQLKRVDGRPVRVAILSYLVRDAFDRALYIEGLVLDTSALHTERLLSSV